MPNRSNANKLRLTTDEDFLKAIAESTSVDGVFRYFGLINSGANRGAWNDKIKKLQPDTSHFTGQGHLKGKTHSWSNPIPIEEVLVENSNYNRYNLKKRLLKLGLLLNQCSVCSLGSIWNGIPLALHIDHINGIHNDNRIENLRMICPNCHSQTETYCGKNKGPGKGRTIYNCIDCSIELSAKAISGRCRQCCAKHKSKQRAQKNIDNKKETDVKQSTPSTPKYKVPHPSKEELLKLLWEKSTVKIAIDFKVSDKAIEKWAKGYNIPKPPRGYWRKLESFKTEDEREAYKKEIYDLVGASRFELELDRV